MFGRSGRKLILSGSHAGVHMRQGMLSLPGAKRYGEGHNLWWLPDRAEQRTFFTAP